jgi:hypothetical protein
MDCRAAPQDPGDRRFRHGLVVSSAETPELGDILGDAFAEDQFSPSRIGIVLRIRGGLYFSHLPKIPNSISGSKVYIPDVPAGGALSHGFYYFNFPIQEGYTNEGSC